MTNMKKVDPNAMHEKWQGKIEVISRVSVKNIDDLSVAYTPGVAKPCLAIEKDPNLSYLYTRRSNMIAVITDGSAVLGLGNIGGLAGMPVMEGKCVLFKEFGGVDAFPLCIESQDVDEIVNICKNISGSFGGINLEDISAPRCFEIERRLIEETDIPIFHDDQHGTAVIVLAGIINALKLVGKKFDNIRIVMLGAGAAGVAITKLLLGQGVKDIILCDRKGIICEGDERLNESKVEIAKITNRGKMTGSIEDALSGADVFIGVSGPNTVTADMVRQMKDRPIVFAMSNPDPEINPDIAKEAGAYIVGTGRSDYPNQINNVLAFPGIFRGTLDVRASHITTGMKIAAAQAIASIVKDEELCPEYIIPAPFNPEVGPKVAKAVAEQARVDKVNRI